MVECGEKLDDLDDTGEDVADGRAQQKQESDYDQGNQSKDQGILYQALALFSW